MMSELMSRGGLTQSAAAVWVGTGLGDVVDGDPGVAVGDTIVGDTLGA